MMQLSVGTLRSMTLEELKQATEWAVRFAAMAGPDEPTARRVLLRLAEALCDEYEGGSRTHTGYCPLRPERNIWGFGAMPRNANPCPGAPFLGLPNSRSCPKMPRNAPALLHYCYIFGMPKGWTLREKLDH